VRLEKSASHGLSFLATYTWSSNWDSVFGTGSTINSGSTAAQDANDLGAEYARSIIDMPQRFTVGASYDLPAGVGRSYLNHNGWLDLAIGGWTLNGILSFSSGQPFDAGASGDIANTGNLSFTTGYGYERANLVGGPYPSQKSPHEWLDPASFQVPAQFTFGNLGRDSLRGDWSKNLDLSIFKRVPITEGIRLELRFEAFNVTNTPVWGLPANNLNGPNFGVVSRTANTARQLQFGLKFYF